IAPPSARPFSHRGISVDRAPFFQFPPFRAAFFAFRRSRAFLVRTLAEAAAAFWAICLRRLALSFFARAFPPFGPPIFPPSRPFSRKNSSISVIEPNVLFLATTQA